MGQPMPRPARRPKPPASHEDKPINCMPVLVCHIVVPSQALYRLHTDHAQVWIGDYKQFLGEVQTEFRWFTVSQTTHTEWGEAVALKAT